MVRGAGLAGPEERRRNPRKSNEGRTPSVLLGFAPHRDLAPPSPEPLLLWEGMDTAWGHPSRSMGVQQLTGPVFSSDCPEQLTSLLRGGVTSPLRPNSRPRRRLVLPGAKPLPAFRALSTVPFRGKACAPDVAPARAAPLPLPGGPGSLGERAGGCVSPAALPLL